LRASKDLEKVEVDGEEKVGLDILKKAIEMPIRQIAINAGKDGSVVVDEVKKNENINYGYNARIDKFEDLVKAGVVDPTKVVRSALQNASSVGALFLTTEVVVADLPSKDGDGPAMPSMGGGMGMPGMM